MSPDTVLSLGEFNFSSFEVPEQIRFGGSQRLTVHELVGGDRVIDAMGRSDRPLEWGGVFTGPNATERAQFLDFLRIGGAQQSLTWGGLSYAVVIREFEADYRSFYRIPYRITCEVLSDKTQPVTSAPDPDIDAALGDDLASANTLALSIGDPLLSSLMGILGTAAATVSTFANAAQSTISSVLQPLAAVQGQVLDLIQSASDTEAVATALGGVELNALPADNAQALADQTENMLELVNLFQLRNFCGRMQANLVAINVPQQTMAIAGGNLFQIAQNQYGDALAWTALARANGLTDPFVQGSAILSVPPRPDNAGGVLAA